MAVIIDDDWRLQSHIAPRRINSDIMEGAPLRLVPCWEKLVSDGVAEPRWDLIGVIACYCCPSMVGAFGA